MSDTATAGESAPDEEDGYAGLFGAFRYGFSASDSRLFRVYAFVSFVVGLLLGFVFVLALVRWFFTTLGQSALATTSNAFLGVVAMFVLGPLFAPVLFVARRHRRDESTPTYDAGVALAGFVFLVSLYVGLVVSVPPQYQSADPGAVGSVLYSLPQLWGLVPPVVGAALVVAVHRLLR
ncbi:hypothetical protein [Halomicrococcus gelatinilyticus]|uniref:hypothetical protein n=1 Tax=Halomicrococcus gelatinilyticus TaxID=1702103 RepID=UPI002E1354C8